MCFEFLIQAMLVDRPIIVVLWYRRRDVLHNTVYIEDVFL
jgi:hypothetical protein